MKHKVWFFRFISVVVGVFFIFSAFVKLYPIEILQIAMVETGFINWFLAPFFARLIISAEMFMGLFLVLNIKHRFFTFLAGFSLIIFSIYLVLLIVFQGNDINCNCFGLFLIMNPIESIFKNLIILFLLVLLYFYNKSIHFKAENKVIILGIIITICLPFILNPITFKDTNYETTSKETYKMDFSIIYENPSLEKPKIDLTKGKHLVGFFSSSCTHCIVAGYNLKVLSNEHPNWSLYFFINGDDSDLKQFHTLTKSELIPHSKLPKKELLILAGNKLPAIFLINNTMVEQRISPDNINETSINEWFLR